MPGWTSCGTTAFPATRPRDADMSMGCRSWHRGDGSIAQFGLRLRGLTAVAELRPVQRRRQTRSRPGTGDGRKPEFKHGECCDAARLRQQECETRGIGRDGAGGQQQDARGDPQKVAADDRDPAPDRHCGPCCAPPHRRRGRDQDDSRAGSRPDARARAGASSASCRTRCPSRGRIENALFLSARFAAPHGRGRWARCPTPRRQCRCLQLWRFPCGCEAARAPYPT